MTPLSPVRKGYIGEQNVVVDLIKKNHAVYLPVVDDTGIDMVVETAKNIYRVQVKTIHTMKSKTSIEVKLDNHIAHDHKMILWLCIINRRILLPMFPLKTEAG